jgi:hypothetical protein
LPNPLFDLLADAVALALEQPYLASDLTLDNGLPEIEEAQLALDLLFKSAQGRKWHGVNHT